MEVKLSITLKDSGSFDLADTLMCLNLCRHYVRTESRPTAPPLLLQMQKQWYLNSKKTSFFKKEICRDNMNSGCH